MTSKRRPLSRGSRLNETRNYVIDLETFGTGPDAVVAAAALVQFDSKETTLVGRWTLDAEEQEKRGRKIDADTVMWWLRQSPAARGAVASDEAFAKRSSVSGFLIDLRDILTPRAGSERDLEYTLWAKPAHFDIAVLEHLSRQFKPKWAAHLHRCKMHNVRTALAMVNLVRAGIDWPEDLDESPNPGAHDAAADAMVTAAVMRDALKEIEGFTGLLNVVKDSMQKHSGLPAVVPQQKVYEVLNCADEAPNGTLWQSVGEPHRTVLRINEDRGWETGGSSMGVGWPWKSYGQTYFPARLIAEGLTEPECRHLSGLTATDALAWCAARNTAQETNMHAASPESPVTAPSEERGCGPKCQGYCQLSGNGQWAVYRCSRDVRTAQ